MPAAVGAALAALRVIRSEDGPPLFARVLENAAYLNSGLRELGLRVVEPQPLPDGSTVTTPIVPVVVGDDWKAVLLWRALYDAGVFVNVALHPAVPPAGRAPAHQRDGDARPRDARPRARALRLRDRRLRGRARPSTTRLTAVGIGHPSGLPLTHIWLWSAVCGARRLSRAVTSQITRSLRMIRHRRR